MAFDRPISEITCMFIKTWVPSDGTILTRDVDERIGYVVNWLLPLETVDVTRKKTLRDQMSHSIMSTTL